VINDALRNRFQIKETPYAVQHLHEYRQQVWRDLDLQRTLGRLVLDHDPTGALADFDGAVIPAINQTLNPIEDSRSEELQERRPIKRHPVTDGAKTSALIRGNVVSPAQLRWGQFVPLAKEGVEPAQTRKSTGVGDVDYGESRIRQEALSQKKPLCLGNLNRGNAEDVPQDPPEMAIRHSERSCELLHSGFSQRVLLEFSERGKDQPMVGVDRRESGG
jgi:hypothetical protein